MCNLENEKMLLVHVCCAPCLSGLSEYLKTLGFRRIKGFFYNPNIHPYKEFKKRRHEVRSHEKCFGFDDFEYSDDYPLKNILDGMMKAQNRCEFCFRTRLDEVAQKAREWNFTHFTTTLLISPYQNQGLLRKIGNELAIKNNVKFIDEDMRRFYDLSRKRASEEEMYQQGYCGCIFSEFERYSFKKKGNE